MNMKPANYNMDMSMKMYLHYDALLQRPGISIAYRRWAAEQQDYWMRMYLNANASIPLGTLVYDN